MFQIAFQIFIEGKTLSLAAFVWVSCIDMAFLASYIANIHKAKMFMVHRAVPRK